jgi:dolichol kinase
MSLADPPVASGEITFRQELLRKATHMGALVVPGGYYFLHLDKVGMLLIMIPVTLVMILIDVARLRRWRFWRGFAGKIISPLIRSHEMSGDFTGATYILLSVCLTVALYNKPIAIAALAFVIVGDSLAAVLGRRLGRHKLGHKSIEGSLACLAGTAVVAVLVPNLPLRIGLIGAVVATVVEALPLGVDDNITVPILSGLSMSLLSKVLLST